MIRVTINIIILCLTAQTVVCQSYNIKFRHINTTQGLSANTVLCITQDSRGFLWVGTYDGLNRFDGYKFKNFKHSPDDSTSLGGNSVYSIYEDKSGIMWVGAYNGGLNKFDRNTQTFTRYKSKPDDEFTLSSDDVYAICMGEENILWVGTARGLNKFNIKNSSNTRYLADDSKPQWLRSNIISSLIYDEKQSVLWVGTKSAGLFKLDVNKNTFTQFCNIKNDLSSLSNNHVYTMYRDRSGIIWVGTYGGGLNKFNIRTNSFTRYKNNPADKFSLSDDNVISIFEDVDGNLWIGTYLGGLNLFDRKNNQFVNFKHSLNNPETIGDNLVHSIFQDKSGVFWLGTWSDGLNTFIMNKKFEVYRNDPDNPNSLSVNGVYSIIEDKDGMVWIGTEGGGLNRFNPADKSFIHYKNNPNDNFSIPGNSVYWLYEDTEGLIWMALDGNYLCKLDKKTNKFIRYKNNPNDPYSLYVRQVTVILEDERGDMWIGSFGGGLHKFNKKDKIFKKVSYNPKDTVRLSEMGIYSLSFDSKGTLWVGTYGAGVFAYNRESGKSVQYYNIQNDLESLSDNNVSAIVESKNGDIWIGTYNGLNKLDQKTGKFRRYSEADGLPNNMIYGIEEDDNSNLWISTNKGLSRFNYKTNTIKNYNENDGLQSDEFNQWANHRGRSGKMYFGGLNGFNIFDPNKLIDDKTPAPIVFTDFQLFNRPVPIGYDKLTDRTILSKSINELNQINLTYEDYIFSIEFSSLDYVTPQNITYAYMMEGFDKEWTYVSSDRRFATYTNLNHGNYVFKVKSTNHDGVWGENAASLLINISPPWWKRWWAYTLYGLITLLLLYILRTYDLKRQRLKHQLTLEHDHAEKLEEIDRMKTSFFTNISHEFRTPLTLILGPTETISENAQNTEIKKQADIIKRNASRLLNLINQLLDLSKLEAGKTRLSVSYGDIVRFTKGITFSFDSLARMKDIKLNFSSTSDLIMIYFDRDKIEKVLTNVLSNAFKFTNSGTVSVEIEEITGFIIIKVRDTGIGIPSEELSKVFSRFYQVDISHTKEYQGSGIGLALAKELIEFHKGTISLSSKEGEGTEVTLCIPSNENIYSPSEIIAKQEKETYAEDLIDKESIYLDSQTIKDSAIDDHEKMIVMIVEDNKDMREYIKDALKNDYHIEEAANGEQGFKKAEKLIPDLIISDVMMPKMDGNQLTKLLKSDERTCHIPVVLLTAKSDQQSKLSGLEFGADDYLTKPFDTKELLIRIKNLITIRRKIQERLGKLEFLNKSDEQRISGMDQKFLNKVIEIINNHIGEEEFTIEQFGSELAMSRTQVHRKLKALTGKSASLFIRSFRLTKAKKIIESGEATISEIAYSVGFSSPAYFSKCFKEEFGYSPSEKTSL